MHCGLHVTIFSCLVLDTKLEKQHKIACSTWKKKQIAGFYNMYSFYRKIFGVFFMGTEFSWVNKGQESVLYKLDWLRLVTLRIWSNLFLELGIRSIYCYYVGPRKEEQNGHCCSFTCGLVGTLVLVVFW